MRGRSVTVLSTFSGIGGLDLGLEAAGFEVIGCIEVDEVARRTLKRNRPEWPLVEPGAIEIAAEDPTSVGLNLSAGELTMLAGAPPCQPYSNAALWSPSGWQGLADKRAHPLYSFMSLVDRFVPEVVLLENVPGFIRGPHSAMPYLQRSFARINERHNSAYVVSAAVIDASDLGVPQRRRRAVVVALRNGDTVNWDFLHNPQDLRTAWDALFDIPACESLSRPRGKWADLLPSIPEGWNYLWHTPVGGGLPLFGARTRYWSFLLKLSRHQPSWTISAQPGPSTGPFHWDNRPLSAIELLRLQSFPADWIIEGTARDRQRQIGNATPPLFAEVLGHQILQILGAPCPPGFAHQLGIAPSPAEGPLLLTEVPEKYFEFVGDHPSHPGSGLGPRPRRAADI
jgi:DNA (cytosine-5)-methyltransferase 1